MHVFAISSDVSRDNILRYYILGLSAAGLVSGFYRAFLSRFFNRNLSYKVRQVTPLNDEIVSIAMEPSGWKLEFTPSQFVFVSFASGGVSPETHLFSVTSSPSEIELRLAAKSLGDYTREIKKLKPGDSASVGGPYGKFSSKNAQNRKQIWVAGGIGITPFVSMANDIGDNVEAYLFYCVGGRQEAVLSEDLQKIADNNKSFRLIIWRSE